MQRSALCRSRRELSNAYLLANFGFDTAENEPSKVCRSRWHVEHTVAQELAEAVEDAGREVGGKHVVRLAGQVEDLQVWPLAPRHLELVQQAPRL